jgi:acetyltransferase
MIPTHSARPGRFHPELLYQPRSVCVCGPDTRLGALLWANLAAGGYGGSTSRLPDLAGLAHLPTAPDLTVLTAPGPALPALTALAAAGCYAAIALDALDGIGPAVAATGVRVLGPRSYGISIPAIGLDASLGHLPAPPGKLALVSQSASLCRALLDWAGPNGVGFSHIIGLGGNADLGFSQSLDWLLHDPGTGAVLLDIRRIRNRRAFLSAARAAARNRPVLALRAGGRLLDPSGEADANMAAALRRAGILSVASLEELLAAAETIGAARPARSATPIIVSNAVGPGRLAADAAMRDGQALAALTAEEVASLTAITGVVPADASLGLIHVPADAPTRLAEVAAMLAGIHRVGGVLVVHAPTSTTDAAAMAALVACHATLRIPLLVCAMGETTGAAHRAHLAAAGVPAFATPEQAIRGFVHLEHHRATRAAAREAPRSDVLTLAPDRAHTAPLLGQARAEGRAALSPDAAMAVLSDYGLPLVPGRVAHAAEEAAEAARLLGFPVTLRLLGPITGAADDLRDGTDVRAAAEALAQRHDHAADPASLAFLVQRQPPAGLRLRLRVSDDVMFGTVVRLGTDDDGVDLLPLNLPLAHALIARSRVAASGEAADTEALAEALVRVSQLIVDFPEIAGLDIDPLILDAHGLAVADAALALRPEGDRASRLAIAPYPAELEQRWLPKGAAPGTRPLLIRPIRPEDAESHGAFFARLSAEDVRYRFFTAMREMSPDLVARLTQVDYDREIAFIAVRPPSEGPEDGRGDTVAVARLVGEAGSRSVEFAIVVQPDMKGQGLASHLMRRLIDWARGRGLDEIAGQVLADNQPMIAFVRHLGFKVQRMAGEEDVLDVRLPLVG